MKKPVRLLLSILCSAVLLIAAFILAVNLYVQSAGMQNHIRQALSDAVGLPVSVFRTTFSPWGGFRLDQIKIGAPSVSSGWDLLQAERFEVRCEWIPLLRGQIVLKRIALDSPVFVFQQTTTKRLVAPPKANPANTPLSANPPAENSRPATSPPQDRAKVVQTSVLDIRKLLLRDGTFKFLAQNGSEIFRLESVRCSLNAEGKSGEFAGDIEVAKAVIFQQINVTNIESAVSLSGKKLNIKKIGGDLAGGSLDGALDVDFGNSNQPYNIRLRLSKAQLAQFFTPDSTWAEELSGLIHAKFNLSGSRGKNQGHTEVTVSRGKISHLPWLQTISQLTRGGEWDIFNIQKAEIRADIADSAAIITPSALTSEHVNLEFSGPVDRKQKLDLQGRLLMDDSFFKKLPTEARENFVDVADPKNHALDFVVNGTISAPKSNFMERLIGDRLKKRVQQFLHSFIGGDETPEPSPLASPLPTVPPTP